MAKLALTLACGDYDRTLALRTGAVRPEGQHMSLAMPEMLLAEYTLRSPRGVPLDQAPRPPGLAAPVGGKLKPSDAPGLGLEYRLEDFAPFA